jgi:hypothetical protein
MAIGSTTFEKAGPMPDKSTETHDLLFEHHQAILPKKQDRVYQILFVILALLIPRSLNLVSLNHRWHPYAPNYSHRKYTRSLSIRAHVPFGSGVAPSTLLEHLRA